MAAPVEKPGESDSGESSGDVGTPDIIKKLNDLQGIEYLSKDLFENAMDCKITVDKPKRSKILEQAPKT